MDQTILEVQDLRIHFELREGTVKALNGIDLVLKEGRTLGLVGETGAGKTTLAKGIMGLTAKPYGKIKSGKILYEGKNLLEMDKKQLRRIEPHPVKRTEKNIKFPRSAAERCWPFFMRRGKACAFPSASERPDYAGHVSCCNSEYTAGSSGQARACR